MGLFVAFNHLLNFASPAAVVALLLCTGSLALGFQRPAMQPWWAQVALNFIVGCAVLVAGLVWGGRDGKVLTYTALVLACASCQWVLLRGWRG